MKIFNSKKHLVSFTFIAIYFVFSFLGAVRTFSIFTGLLYDFMGLIPSALILCYLLFEDIDFKFKNFIFPLAFGIIAFRNLYTVAVSVIGTPKYILFENGTKILFALSVVSALFNILCFFGTLFNFKLSILLKIGCIGYILTTIIMSIYEFISLGGMEYIYSIPKEILPINIISLIKYLSIILFYTGNLILTTNKKNTDLV